MTASTCPICDHGGEIACARCGWPMTDGPWAGELTDADRAAFADRLAAARQAFDLDVAVAAAGFPDDGDDALLDLMVAGVRGGPPDRADVAEARRRAGRPATGNRRALAAAVAPALADLVVHGGSADRLTIVEIGTEAITQVVVSLDGAGVPVVSRQERRPWPKALQHLPEDRVAFRIVLAGGVGGTVADPDVRALAADLSHGTTMVLHRTAGWAVADRVATACAQSGASVVRVPRSDGWLDDNVLDGLLVAAPIRHPYGLAAVALSGDRRTSVRAIPLFSAGATPATASAVTVRVDAPASGGRLVALGVVTGPSGTPVGRSALVGLEHVALSGDGGHELEFELVRPGEVRLRRPSAVQHGGVDWDRVLASVPSIYEPVEAAVDLVVAVELGGADRTVQQRIRFATDLAERVAACPDPAAMRIGVIGYRDHVQREPVLSVRHGLAPAVDAVRHFSDLATSPVVEPKAAPLEDALDAAARMSWQAARRVLIVVGSREPHPSDGSTISFAPCPRRIPWVRAVGDLRNAKVRVHAVRDEPRASVGRRIGARGDPAFWTAPSRQAQPLQDVDPARLAAALTGPASGRQPDPLLLPLMSPSAHEESP